MSNNMTNYPSSGGNYNQSSGQPTQPGKEDPVARHYRQSYEAVVATQGYGVGGPGWDAMPSRVDEGMPSYSTAYRPKPSGTVPSGWDAGTGSGNPATRGNTGDYPWDRSNTKGTILPAAYRMPLQPGVRANSDASASEAASVAPGGVSRPGGPSVYGFTGAAGQVSQGGPGRYPTQAPAGYQYRPPASQGGR